MSCSNSEMGHEVTWGLGHGLSIWSPYQGSVCMGLYEVTVHDIVPNSGLNTITGIWQLLWLWASSRAMFQLADLIIRYIRRALTEFLVMWPKMLSLSGRGWQWDLLNVEALSYSWSGLSLAVLTCMGYCVTGKYGGGHTAWGSTCQERVEMEYTCRWACQCEWVQISYHARVYHIKMYIVRY